MDEGEGGGGGKPVLVGVEKVAGVVVVMVKDVKQVEAEVGETDNPMVCTCACMSELQLHLYMHMHAK